MKVPMPKLRPHAGNPLFALLVFVPLLCASIGGQFFFDRHATAATNGTINFQARLMNAAGAIAPDGDYNVEFKLYSTLTSSGSSQGSCTGDSTCKWVETRTSGNKVHVANGYVTVNLGSVTSFSGTIDWDQDLWLTMNIGGTGSPTWDGEMTPRLKLTGVPYAFRAGQLASLAGSNTGVLKFAASLGQATTITLPDPGASTATVCYQTSTACGFLTGAATDYIQNQTAGAQATANFWISGVGKADTSLQAPLFDTPTSGALAIGTTNATAINLNKNTTLAAGQTLTVTSGATSLTGAATGDALTVSNSTSTGNIAVFKDNATSVATIADGGAVTFVNSTDSSAALRVQNSFAGNVLVVNTTSTGPAVTVGRSGTLGRLGAVVSSVYDASSTTTRNFTSLRNVPVGHTLIGSLAISASTIPSLSVTDSKGNTYSVDASSTTGSSVTVYTFSSRITTALTTSDTITLTIGASTARWAVDVEDFDNILTSPVDKTSTNTATSTSLTTGATATTTAANEIVFGAFGFGSGRVFTAGAGFTPGTQLTTSGGSNDRSLNVEWKQVTATGTQTATGTIDVSGVYAANVVTYKSTDPTLAGATGSILLSDGTSSGFGSLLTPTMLTANRTITLPDASGSLCLDSGNCDGSSGTGYILNQSASAQSANIFIRSKSTSAVTGVLQGANGQTADLLNIQTWNGTTATTVLGVNNVGVVSLLGGQTVDLTTPTAATATGITIVPGASSGASSNGASVTIKGSNGTGTTSVTGGAVVIQGGNATGASGIRIGGSVSIDAGTGSAAASNGTVSIGATNALSVALGGTSATSITVATNGVGRAVIDASNNLFLGNANASGAAAAPNAFTVSGTNASAATVAGAALTIQAGAGNTTGAGGQLNLQGGAGGNGAATAGGTVVLQGGSATGTGASNGGQVTIQGGTAAGTGVKGLIQLNGATYFTTGSYSSGSTSTITQSLVDSNSAILATATAASLTFTVPNPTVTAASGRVLYVTNVGSNAFRLSFASTNLALAVGSTATLIWSGSAWTGAGVDTDTLQNGYNNSTGGTTPEILLDSTRNGLDIQDNSLTSGTRLLAVRGTATSTTLGSPLFVVDNTGKVGIGIEQPTRSLDVAVSNSSLNAMPLLVEQAGVGDVGIEFKNPTKNFYAGIDATDGQFKISSAAAGAGNFTVPSPPPDHAGSPDSGNNNMISSTKVTTVPGGGGSLSSITVYIGNVDGTNPHMKVALYDATGTSGGPGTVLSSSGSQTLTANSWNSFPMSGATVSASTTYWLSFNVDGSSTQYLRSASSGTNTAKYTAGGSNNFSSSPFTNNPTISQTSGDIYAIYMTLSAAAGSDNLNTSLFSLSDTGSARFGVTSDSTTAFQIQSALGASLFTVDSLNNTVNVGGVGSTTTPTIVNVATSDGSTQAINIGGTTSTSVANGTTVLIQGGNTAAAVSIQALASGTVGIGTNNAANTIQIGSTSLNSGTQTISIGTNNTSGGTTNITIGTGSTATGGTTALQAKTALSFATNGVGRGIFDTSNNLYLGNASSAGTAAAPNAFTVSGTNSSAATVAGAAVTVKAGNGNTTGAGGLLTLQGGASGAGAAAAGGGVTIQGGSATGTGASNGGTVTLQGGSSTNGTKGLIQLNGGTYFTTASYSSGSSATITQSFIDSNAAILATATAASLTFTVPSPTVTTAGRILYVTNVGGTNAFTLSFGSSTLSLNIGATATLVWSGSAWTGAGADSATLQNDYANSAGGTTPEILVDSTRNGLDIQDNSLTSGTRLLAVRGTATATTLGSPLFVVDNTGKVGIGIEQPTRNLHIAINNTTTTAPALLIDQTGSGDASQEFKSTAGSFFAGIDTSDSGKFKINSSAASGSTAQIGRTTIGGSTDSGDLNTQNAVRFTMGGTSGSLTSISVYLSGGSSSNLYSVAVYADGGSAPSTFIASSSPTTLVPNSWNTASVSASLTASTSYWLAFNTNDPAANGKYDSTGTSCYNARTFASGWTVPFGACTASSQNFSIYGTYTVAGSLDSFGAGALFSLTATGQAAFQNFSNSTTAFQVLNVASTALLSVDTSTPNVSVGVTGATATASTVNVATSTGATQTINIGSATTGTAANGTTVLIQGGNTATAVSVQALASGTIGIGSNNAANTIQVGSTSLNSGTQTINIGTNNTSGGTTNVTIGNGATATAGTTALQAKTSVTVATNGVTRATFDNANTMYLGNGVTNAAPNDFVVQGTGASAATVAGGKLTLIGGTGNTTGAGGAVVVQGGASAGAGAGGAVTIQGGTASATAGSNGGVVTINGANGSSTGTGGAGAYIWLNAGNAGGSGNNAGGNIIAELGAATGTGAQGTFQVQNALGASLLTVDPSNTASSLNLISNGGAETGSPPTGWAAQGTGSSVATGTGTDAASGSQSAKVTFGTNANAGTKVNFVTAPTASTTVNYIVSFSAKLVSGTAMSSTLQVLYSPDNGTTTPQCTNYSTQALSTTAWTKITCTFVPGSTTVTTALLIIRQSDAPGVSRVVDIDNLSVVQQNSTGTTNVGDLKVGGALSQGLTLLTLDTYAATPFSGSNASLAGSMYFDTSQGKIQCYDGTNWGACGAAPNSIITLSPEFAGAVLHGTVGTAGGTDNNIGTLTSDFCSDFLDINDATHGTSICGTNETFNFYRWTSPQSNAQTYDVYITYQLPSTFKNFVSGQTNMLGRTDSANSTVTYSVYKNVSGTGLTLCSAAKTISTGVQTSWQTATPTTDLSTCSFAANNSIVVKVEVTSSSNANAYIGTLNFQYSNQ